MECKFSTNGLSLASAQSFCKFISDYLYDTFRIKGKVNLERTNIETLFNVQSRKIPNMCEFFTLEFSDLILFDKKYYIGKGPKDEYIAKALGYNIFFFNWYIFVTEDITLPRNNEEYKDLYYINNSNKSVEDYIKFISGKILFKGETGIVFSIKDKQNSNSIDKNNILRETDDQTDNYQTWVRQS
jgi:hypothetical protein